MILICDILNKKKWFNELKIFPTINSKMSAIADWSKTCLVLLSINYYGLGVLMDPSERILEVGINPIKRSSVTAAGDRSGLLVRRKLSIKPDLSIRYDVIQKLWDDCSTPTFGNWRSRHPPALPGVKRVSELKILGVYMSDKLEFTPHINYITTAAVQSTYARRVLRAHGLTGPKLGEVTRTTAAAKFTYACSSW